MRLLFASIVVISAIACSSSRSHGSSSDDIITAICRESSAIARFPEPISVKFNNLSDDDFSTSVLSWEIEKVRTRSNIEIYLDPDTHTKTSYITVVLLPNDVTMIKDDYIPRIIAAIRSAAAKAGIDNSKIDDTHIESKIRSVYLMKGSAYNFTINISDSNLYSMLVVRSPFAHVASEKLVAAEIVSMLGYKGSGGTLAPDGTIFAALRNDAAEAEMSKLDYAYLKRIYTDKHPGGYPCSLEKN